MKRSNEGKTRKMPSVSARNMIKSFARPGKVTPKLANGAKVLMLGPGLINHLTLPSQLKQVHILELPIHLRLRVQTLIVNSATWI
jgi:hypothetical protein